MNLTKIITYVLFAVSVALAYYLWSSINTTIEFRKSIASTEEKIVEKLRLIRESEKIFLEQHGHYTSDWDSLVSFIQNGKVPVTVRTETIIPLSYGKDSIQVKIDTIDVVDAKDKIFKKTYAINSADNGIFMGFLVKQGDEVVKGQKSYRLQRATNNKIEDFTFLEKGNVASLANITSGSEVSKGAYLITVEDYQFNPNIDISNLKQVPGSDKEFEIFTDKLDRNGVPVNVIFVRDPAPINPDRKESNEAINRKPLQFGSKTDVKTSGNWE